MAGYPKYLYKYVPLNNYDIENLEKKRIHLSSFDSANDIYEKYRIANFCPFPLEKDIKFNHTYFGIQITEKYLSEETKKNIRNRLIKSCEDALKKTKFSCFSSSNCSEPMWIHYANRSKGICIEFNSYFFDEEIKSKNLIKKIRYKEKYSGYSQTIYNDLLNDNTSYILKPFLQKNKYWEYEKEYRLYANCDIDNKYINSYPFILIKENNNYFYNYSKRPKLIKSIYLGLNIEEKSKKQLISTIEKNYKEVYLYQSFIDENSNINFKVLNETP